MQLRDKRIRELEMTVQNAESETANILTAELSEHVDEIMNLEGSFR